MAPTATGKVPHIGFTAEFVPFLRFRKPQSQILTKILTRKRRAAMKSEQRSREVVTKLVPDAAAEDHWDSVVAKQMRAELGSDPEHSSDPTASYQYSTQLMKLWYTWRHERRWQDSVARGAALQTIVDGVKNATSEHNLLVDDAAPQGPHPRDGRSNGKSRRGNSNVQALRIVPKPGSHMHLVHLARQSPEEDGGDPYNTSSWQELAAGHEMRIVGQMQRGIEDDEFD